MLVVDDEAFIRLVAAGILEDARATVFEAGDAEEALAMLDDAANNQQANRPFPARDDRALCPSQ